MLNTSVTASQPSRPGLNHMELVFCLPRQRYGPIFVTTGSCYLSQWDFHWSFWNDRASWRGPHCYFGFCLVQALPPSLRVQVSLDGLGRMCQCLWPKMVRQDSGPPGFIWGAEKPTVSSGHKSSPDPPLPRKRVSLNWLIVFIQKQVSCMNLKGASGEVRLC